MAELVLGVGASHTTLMNTKWAEVDHLPRAHAFRNALAQARQQLTDAGVDVVVIVGSNHFRGFWLDLMPMFTLGVGSLEAAGEHGTPTGEQKSHPELAHHLLDAVVREGFDMAFSVAMQVDHGISHAIQYVVPDGAALVPLVVNTFAPPLPPLARCNDLGRALGQAIRSHPSDLRVGIVASGGLSHRLPFPDWRSPQSDNDEFLVESWASGRGRWEEFEARRRSIVVAAPADLNEAFDADLLAALDAGHADKVIAAGDDLVAVAGNGANEIRSWILMAAACNWAGGRTLCYSPMPEWLTGMAVWTTTATRAPSQPSNEVQP